jgi:hypothetical protein
MVYLVDLLYECEPWSLTLRQGRGYVDNRDRNIFGPKMDEVIGELDTILNAECLNLYCSCDGEIIKLRKMPRVRHVVHIEETRNVRNILVWRVVGKT